MAERAGLCCAGCGIKSVFGSYFLVGTDLEEGRRDGGERVRERMCLLGSASLKPSTKIDIPHKKADPPDSARGSSMGEEEEAGE